VKRVLVIDDDVFYTKYLARIFAQRKWLVETCHTMEDALKNLEALELDLIISDIFMPGIGGIEGIQLLKNTGSAPPVIAISGGWDELPPEQAVAAAIKVGASAGIAKPVKNEVLDKILKDLNLGPKEVAAPNWSKTVDGATDWDAVFDAPVTGLIAWMSNAGSFDLMKMSVITIFDHLLNNTDKGLDEKHYQARLKDMLSRANPKNKKQTLGDFVGLLNEIKTKLKEEEARFLSERNYNEFSGNRERRAAVAARNQDTPTRHRKSLFVGGALAVLAIGLVFAFSVFEDGNTVGEQKNANAMKDGVVETNPDTYGKPVKEDEEPKRSGKQSADKNNVKKIYRMPMSNLLVIYRTQNPELWVPPDQNYERPGDALPNATPFMSLAAVIPEVVSHKGRASKLGVALKVLPILNVKSYDMLKDVCTRVPGLLDLLMRSLDVLFRTPKSPTKDVLAELAQKYKNAVNDHLGGDRVSNVILMSGRDLHRMSFADSPCHVLSPLEVQDLLRVHVKWPPTE
jgi:CheY-like chemotaxis protein